jgi:HTH-type transcriptional regulator/antitoxin HigA
MNRRLGKQHALMRYTAIVERIEELLSNPENIDNPDAKGYVELNLLSDLVADYEETFHPIQPPILT